MDLEKLKREAALRALDFVRPGMKQPSGVAVPIFNHARTVLESLNFIAGTNCSRVFLGRRC